MLEKKIIRDGTFFLFDNTLAHTHTLHSQNHFYPHTEKSQQLDRKMLGYIDAVKDSDKEITGNICILP